MMDLSPPEREVPLRLTDEARRDFAVVIPAVNEAPLVPALIAELRETFERYELSGEVLFVDDGSTDGTADLVEKHATDWPLLKILRHPSNLGKTEAMITAARATERKSTSTLGR